MPSRRLLLQSAILLPVAAHAEIADDDDTWRGLKPMFFGDKVIDEATGYVTVDAPGRPKEAGHVPVALTFPARDKGDRVVAANVIIDENPAPLVTVIKRGRVGAGDFDFALPLRVNSYSWLRVIAETESGALHMAKTFVKASGGCSAPASKSAGEAEADVGAIAFRAVSDLGRPEAVVTIQHPNYSGMQMDQLTRMYAPAWYLTRLRVSQGDDLLFSMENGISVAENPSFRFSFVGSGAPVRIEAKDSRGQVYTRTFGA